MRNFFWKLYTKAGPLKKGIRFFSFGVNFFFAALYSHVCWVLGEPFLSFIGRRASKNQGLDLKKVNTILVIRLDRIGDFVMTSPFLRELRREAPQAKITLLVASDVWPLASQCPYVDEALEYPVISGVLSILMPPWRPFFYAQKHLWKKNFELAIHPRWGWDLYQSAFIAYFSGAVWRAGYSEFVSRSKAFLNCGYHLLYSHALSNRTLSHEVEHSLAFLPFLGGEVKDTQLELWSSKSDEARIDQIFTQNGLTVTGPSKPFAVCPGSLMPKKEWPSHSFAALCGQIQDKWPCPILIIGGRADRAKGESIQKTLPGNDKLINLCGVLSLSETYTLLKRCSVYVGGDTGPAHMAAAAGIPVSVIGCHPLNGSVESDNSPLRFGPWCLSKVVVQPQRGLPPCQHECDSLAYAHCITQVTVEEVLRAVQSLIAHV